jgi:hypothetical protein
MQQTTLNDDGMTAVVDGTELMGMEATYVVIHGHTVHGKCSEFDSGPSMKRLLNTTNVAIMGQSSSRTYYAYNNSAVNT